MSGLRICNQAESSEIRPRVDPYHAWLIRLTLALVSIVALQVLLSAFERNNHEPKRNSSDSEHSSALVSGNS